ncbi:hypothetical protein [Streptomyces sp. CB03238]|uniref:hypothetical protein n=1 Tax=Streptomyces sp. CB03238 TaxID=1907777 RepID=UPI000A1226A8|nr:hypothetical protein [Streptomyces sp. CB03238]ORT58167.1 hypothetical protein BKD26_19895 [Streptomyces sp. CB03238]
MAPYSYPDAFVQEQLTTFEDTASLSAADLLTVALADARYQRLGQPVNLSIPLSSGPALTVQQDTDSQPRIAVSPDGELTFGDGTSDPDVVLRRVGPSTLAVVEGTLSQGGQAVLDASKVGAANGVAALDANGQVPSAQLPPTNVGLSQAQADARYILKTSAGAASGVATLDASSKIPTAQVPDLSGTYVATSTRGAASGVATLDSASKVPVSQIPDLANTYVTASTNLDNQYGPGDHGMFTWSCGLEHLRSSGQPESGGVRMIKVRLKRPVTIGWIWMHLTSGGTSLTANQCFAGLYTTAGARVAVTADQSTAWSTIGEKKMSLTTPYNAAAGDYFIAFVANGTTIPQFTAASNNSSSGLNMGVTGASLRFANGPTGQTSLPASINMGTISPGSASYFVALS